jgi:hypothetical protein
LLAKQTTNGHTSEQGNLLKGGVASTQLGLGNWLVCCKGSACAMPWLSGLLLPLKQSSKG